MIKGLLVELNVEKFHLTEFWFSFFCLSTKKKSGQLTGIPAR